MARTPHIVTRRRARQIIRLLVIVDVLILVVGVALWLMLRDDPEANPANDGLRGSLPPVGQRWPALDGIAGIEPPVPSLGEVRGTATMLVATCLNCQSGDIFGGFLARLAAHGVPEGARVVVVGWGGDAADWRAEWRIPAEMEVHVAAPGAPEAAARARVRTGESGIAFLHDTRGRWRATYSSGQLDVDDVAHDLRALGR